MNEPDVLRYNMFAADRDMNVKLLTKSMVTTRTEHQCVICIEVFPPGSRACVQIERYEGRVMSFYACPLCCEAMAASWTDAGKAIEARTAIGMIGLAP